MTERATVSDPLPAARGAHHVGLSVADLEAMIAFYCDALGFSVEVAFELPGGRMAGAMLRRPDGTGLELLCHADSAGQAASDPHATMLQRGYGHWALAVTDVASTHTRLLAAGVREVWSPRPAPPPATGAMSYLADPEGNLFELVEITDGPPTQDHTTQGEEMTDVTRSAPPTELLGRPVPYVMEAGGGRAHLLIDQVGRCLAGAEETGDALSMMTLDGPAGRPIPLHFHNQEYEFFFCHRGTMQLWLDGESRILHAGDFGYAPPRAVHAYGLLSHHAGFVGPIVPGGWDRFFDLTGIPYAGTAPFPVGFQPEVPFAKFGQAEHDFDMKYLPEEPYADPRSDASDDSLPGSVCSYFLRAGEGPRHRIAGGLVTTLCTSAETDGKLAMLTLELPRGAGVPAHVHDQTTEGIYVLEGSLRVWLDGEEHRVDGGGYVSIPAGTPHRWEGSAFFTKAISITTPGGLEAIAGRAGEATELHMFDATEPAALAADTLAAAASGLDLRLA